MMELIKSSTESTLSILLRHAERDQIPHGSFGSEFLLNKMGELNAYQFGLDLRDFKINKIFTSPVLRCIQTSEFIAGGYSGKIEIVSTPALGDPGLHISDEKIAGEYFRQLGVAEIYRRFANGIPTPGIHNVETFKVSMTNYINEHSATEGITLFITHDLIIEFYHYCLTNQENPVNNWVNYLSGIIVNKSK